MIQALKEPPQGGETTASLKPDLELGRAVWHASSICGCGVLAGLVSHQLGTALLVIGVGLLLFWELLRRKFGCQIACGLLRPEESNQLSAGTHFAIALAIIYLTLATPVVQAACFMMAAGDPMARIVGKTLGDHGRKLPGSQKTYWGSFGCLASSVLMGYFTSWWLPISSLMVIAGAIMATIAEALPDRYVTDNFRMTLVTASAMQLVMAMPVTT